MFNGRNTHYNNRMVGVGSAVWTFYMSPVRSCVIRHDLRRCRVALRRVQCRVYPGTVLDCSALVEGSDLLG